MPFAAKEEMLSPSSDPCVFFSLAAFEGVGENSRLGSARKNPAPHPGSAWTNSASALGIEEVVLGNRVGCRGSGNSSAGSPTSLSQGCIVSIFNPSCKPPQLPSCPAVFFESWGNHLAGDPVNPAGSNPEDLVKAGAAAAATAHIVRKGLVVPLRSQIVRDILNLGEEAGTAVALVPIVTSELHAFADEFQAWRSRQCSTIWTKP